MQRCAGDRERVGSIGVMAACIVVGMSLADSATTLARVPPDSTAPAVQAPIKVTDADVDRVPILVTRSPGESVALVIGIEEYGGLLPRADFAAGDAVRMQEYLTGLLGFHEDQVLTLLNKKATRIEMAQAVERWLPQRVQRDSTVFVYFAGLGTAHPKTRDAYLLPADGVPSTLTRSGYPLKRLYQQLAALPARHVFVMLDACFGGVGDRSVLTGTNLVPRVELSDASINKGGKSSCWQRDAEPRDVMPIGNSDTASSPISFSKGSAAQAIAIMMESFG